MSARGGKKTVNVKDVAQRIVVERRQVSRLDMRRRFASRGRWLRIQPMPARVRPRLAGSASSARQSAARSAPAALTSITSPTAIVPASTPATGAIALTHSPTGAATAPITRYRLLGTDMTRCSGDSTTISIIDPENV